MKTLPSISTIAFLFYLLIVFIAGCSSAYNSKTDHTKIYTPEQLKSDANELFGIIEEVHPRGFMLATDEKYLLTKNDVFRQLDRPMTRLEFYRIISAAVAVLDDGHTGLSVPTDEFSTLRLKGMLSFPFQVRLSDNGVIVERNYSDDSLFADGSRLNSVNGRSADSLFNSFVRYFSGEQFRYRAQSAATYSSLLLWMHDITPPYIVNAVTRSGKVHSAVLQGATIERKKYIDSLIDRTIKNRDPYTFHITDDSIAVIDFRSMIDLQSFEQFLKKSFTEIKSKRAKGLIIDIRDNGGGNAQLGDALISYISQKPYTLFHRKEWKMSYRYKQHLRERYIPWYLRWFPVTWVNSDAKRFFGAEDGEIIVLNGDTIQPGHNPLRYSGPTALLIGVKTFSSAVILADAVKEFGLATVIGEESGGHPSSFGEVFGGELTETQLRYFCSSAQFVRVNGVTDDHNGVVPDILVTTTIGSEDSTIRVAKEIISRPRLDSPY